MYLGVCVKIEILGKGVCGGPNYGGIGKWPNQPADAERQHVNAQATQRLTKLQTDSAGPKHGHGFWQLLPLKNVVVHDQSIAELALVAHLALAYSRWSVIPEIVATPPAVGIRLGYVDR